MILNGKKFSHKTNSTTINMYFDGHPSDWLNDFSGSSWQTISFLIIEDCDKFAVFSEKLCAEGLNLKKWSTSSRSTNKKYRKQFSEFFSANWSQEFALLNIISFKQSDLIGYKELILRDWTDVSRSIGFEIYDDPYGNKRGKHGFLDGFTGFNVIDVKYKKLFTLLPMAYLIRDQYYFYKKHFLTEFLRVIIYHDPISGDNSKNKEGQTALKNLVIHQFSDLIDIDFVEHPESIQKDPDLIVDNTSGLFNSIIQFKNSQNKYFNSMNKRIFQEVLWQQLYIQEGYYDVRKMPLDDFDT